MKAIVTIEFSLLADSRNSLPQTLTAAKAATAHIQLLADKIFTGELASKHKINLNSVAFQAGISEEE